MPLFVFSRSYSQIYLISALDSSDLIGFRIIISLDELGLIKGKTCYEETEFPDFDFLITDITGAKEGFYRNRIG